MSTEQKSAAAPQPATEAMAWVEDLTAFLRPIAEQQDQQGADAEGLGQFLPSLRRLLARAAAPQGEQQAGWKWVPVEPTEEMVKAYLQANDAYWRRTDEMPPPPGKWRTGRPTEATAESYKAMISAAPARSASTSQQYAMMAFLTGEAPLDGVWFGERHPKEKGMFWWRKHLRYAFPELLSGG